MAAQVQKRAMDDPAVEAFIRGQPSYLFQEPVWCRVLASLGHKVDYYCLEEDGRIVLAQPAVHMRLVFFRLLYCGLPYGGPVGDLGRLNEFVEGLAGVVRGEGVHALRFSRNLYDGDMAPPGFTVQEHVQQVLHFGGRTSEQVWSGLKSRVRRDVRLAERRGVTVEPATAAADRDALFVMYAQTMARNETFVVWKREMIERIWELLVQPGRGEILIARHEGRALAGMVVLYNGKRCFYFLGASSGEQRGLCPSDALIWAAINRALARGCEDFDFMISSRQDAPLIEFKAKWGAAQHPFRFYERNLSRLVCGLWNASFQMAKTRLGGRLIRLMRGH